MTQPDSIKNTQQGVIVSEYDCNNLEVQYTELCQAIKDIAGKRKRINKKNDMLDLVSMKEAKKLLEQRIKFEYDAKLIIARIYKSC